MLAFITNNLGTILVCTAVALIVAGIVVYMVIQKKKGKSSCGCGCANCAMKGSCHKQGASEK